VSSASTLSMHPKNICHPKLVVNQDATSSEANSRPPIGALKATATPMPEPATFAIQSASHAPDAASITARVLRARLGGTHPL